MTTDPRDAEEIAVLLHTVREFRAWIDSNVLFPVVPDRERDPLRISLKQVERTLVGALYDLDALDKLRIPVDVKR